MIMVFPISFEKYNRMDPFERFTQDPNCYLVCAVRKFVAKYAIFPLEMSLLITKGPLPLKYPNKYNTIFVQYTQINYIHFHTI